jgi:ATP-dependent RNA helicase DDX55/SPB4
LKENLGHKYVTKVQKTVLPLFLSKKDVVVKACTGSGKTLAFLVPMLQIIADIVEKKKAEMEGDGDFF